MVANNASALSFSACRTLCTRRVAEGLIPRRAFALLGSCPQPDPGNESQGWASAKILDSRRAKLFWQILGLLSVFGSGSFPPGAFAQAEEKSMIIERGGTAYLNDPQMLAERPILLPTPKPTPTPAPRPKPTASTRKELPAAVNQPHLPAGSLRMTSFNQATAPVSPGNSASKSTDAVISSRKGSGLTVETTVPYPTQYTPARVSNSWRGPSVIIPATPTRFTTTRVGTQFDGNRFQSREFEGFINYGSPIRTFAPVYDSRGRPVGLQVFETPNPILQPVFRTIEVQR